MPLNDLILECDDDPEMLSNVLKLLDATVEYIHSCGFYIRDFDPKKIIIGKRTPNLNNFKGIISKINYDSGNDIKINLYQMAKIGLMAYNHIPLEGSMNQNYFNFILENLKSFNQNGKIPNDIYEYYEDLFFNGNFNYLNDYLSKKYQEITGGRGTSIRKSLVTEAGKALSTGMQLNMDNDNEAFVNILFLPSIITLLYLIGLFIYTFILK